MNYFTHKLLLIVFSTILTGLSTHCMKNLISPSLEISNNDQITSDALPHELWQSIVFSALEDELSAFRFSTTLLGHTSTIKSVAYSPDGKTALTGSDDGTARLWDAATGKPLYLLLGHTCTINAVAYSPDGRTVLTGSMDNTARLWDVKTGEQLHILGHIAFISSVAYSPDGKTILTGSKDTTARLWDVTTGKQLLILEGHTDWISSVAYSPDGKTVLTGSSDYTARLWKNFNWNNETKELFVKYYPLLRKSFNQESVARHLTESKEDALGKAMKTTFIENKASSVLYSNQFDASFIDNVNLDELF